MQFTINTRNTLITMFALAAQARATKVIIEHYSNSNCSPESIINSRTETFELNTCTAIKQTDLPVFNLQNNDVNNLSQLLTISEGFSFKGEIYLQRVEYHNNQCQSTEYPMPSPSMSWLLLNRCAIYKGDRGMLQYKNQYTTEQISPYYYAKIDNSVDVVKFVNEVLELPYLVDKDLSTVRETLEERVNNAQEKCPVCFIQNNRAELVMTKCLHVYCRSCVGNILDQADRDKHKCPCCNNRETISTFVSVEKVLEEIDRRVIGVDMDVGMDVDGM
eukprot:Pgem_evm1s8084